MTDPTLANYASVIVLMAEMRNAADQAGADWLATTIEARTKHDPTFDPKYHMIDLCGNSWITLKDKRTKLYKAFKGAGYITQSGESISLQYGLRSRQEFGLHQAACEAALKVLTDRGITEARVHSYID